MDSKTVSEWLVSLSTPEKIRALALLYSRVTIGARQVFLPGEADGKEREVINVLRGINELHHTIANGIIAYSFEEVRFSPAVFAEQLFEIVNEYGIQGLLVQALDFSRSRNLSVDC